MSGASQMKVFYEVIENGEPTLKFYSTTSMSAPHAVKIVPGVGKQFWAFSDDQLTRNPAEAVGWTFQDAPVASSSANTNLTSINAITVSLDDVIFWSEEGV